MTTATAVQPTAEQRLEAAQARRDKLAADRETEAARLEKAKAALARTVAKQNQQLEDSKRAIAQREADEAAAELEIQRLAAEITPDPITIDTARILAGELLSAFSDFRCGAGPDETIEATSPVSSRIPIFWAAIDTARDRILTTEVADGAQELTLACDGLILACDHWEEDRSGRFSLDDGMTATSSSIGHAPPESRHCQKLEKALQACLAGEKPTRKPDSVGRLIASGLNFEQIGRTVDYVRPDGSLCLGTLGRFIDTPDRSVTSHAFVHWFGCRTIEIAWRRRQDGVERRRKQRHSIGSTGHVDQQKRREAGGDLDFNGSADVIAESINAYASRYTATSAG